MNKIKCLYRVFYAAILMFCHTVECDAKEGWLTWKSSIYSLNWKERWRRPTFRDWDLKERLDPKFLMRDF